MNGSAWRKKRGGTKKGKTCLLFVVVKKVPCGAGEGRGENRAGGVISFGGIKGEAEVVNGEDREAGKVHGSVVKSKSKRGVKLVQGRRFPEKKKEEKGEKE